MGSLRGAVLVLCVVLAAGCDAGGTSGGGGGGRDGAAGADGAGPGDAGGDPLDGAPPVADSGLPGVDGGGTGDGGTTTEGGAPPGDSGARDSGPAGPVRPVELALGRYDGCNMLSDGTRRCLGFSFARMSDGSVRSWGGNTDGELADGTTTSRSTPAEVAALGGVQAVAPGNQHACSLEAAGGAVRCWGDGAFGQLGAGGTDVHTTPAAVPGLTGVVQLASGGYHACALLADGSVRCWGMGQFGQLGAPTTATCLGGAFGCALSPVAVSVPGAAALALGNAHSCARTTAGQLYCWGVSQYGQVGAWDPGDSCDDPGAAALPCARTPRLVEGVSGVVEVGLGDAHTCVRLGDGTVRCWGNGRLGQLGDGSITSMADPVAVAGLSGVTQLAVGSAHACALRADGTVMCWGAGYLGQLGFMPASRCTVPMGDFLCQPTPAAIPGIAGVVAIAAGGAHTCSLHEDGTVRCWGYNLSGQLGDGTTTGRGEPVVIAF